MACTKSLNAKSTKMAKIDIANTQSPVCCETAFVLPEHFAFCLCEVLMR